MNNFCITVPTARIQEVEAKLVKLAKRAGKLDLPVSYGYQTAIVTGRKFNPKTKKTEKSVLDVTVVHAAFPPVKMSGWTLAAVLEPFAPDVNLIHGVPGIGDVDPKWRGIVGQCDHCGHSRHRKETFVVRHEDGTEKSVGRTCIADFLGHRDPKALLNYFAWLAEQMKAFEAIEAGFKDEDEGYSTACEFGHWVPDLQKVADVIAVNDGTINDGVIYLNAGMSAQGFHATKGHWGTGTLVYYTEWDDEFGIE